MGSAPAGGPEEGRLPNWGPWPGYQGCPSALAEARLTELEVATTTAAIGAAVRRSGEPSADGQLNTGSYLPVRARSTARPWNPGYRAADRHFG